MVSFFCEEKRDVMNDYLQIANSPSFWITCIPAILMVVFQAVIFTRLAFRASKVTTLTSQQCRTAFRVGATSAIGPAMAIFIVMIGMMAVVGAPMAWLRLNFIGSATTELTATTVGAKAMGVELGSAEYGLTAFSASVWTMTLNGCGWLLFCGLFTDKMDKIMSKFTGGNIALMTAVCGAAVLGTASYLATDQALKSAPHLAAVIASIISMLVLIKISEKHPKLKEYNLGIAMLLGMTVAVIVLQFTK